MAGALMQLVAYGAQDVYLTGNPQITFFKVVYRRHTNFAMESMQQTITGNNTLGGRGVCKLSRNGDLVGSCYVQSTVTQTTHSLNNRFGFNMLKNVELRIGGQKIDKHSNTWMLVWTNLSSSVNQSLLLDKMVGGSMSLAKNTLKGADPAANADVTSVTVPLQFSFCRNPGLALPLIALQYHDVEIVIDYASAAACGFNGATGTTAISNTSLWVDYIFLDTEERKNFAQKPHEYLIETVQEQVHGVSGGSSNSIRLDFNHPVKELIWVGRDADVNGDRFVNFTNAPAGNGESFTDTVLKLNGQERFTTMDTKSNVDNSSKYFNYVQNYSYHTGTPLKGVNTYSFALKPEEHQPSGTCNFSRIDNATLNVKPSTYIDQVTVMAHGYNILRVASGMGGLAYSN